MFVHGDNHEEIGTYCFESPHIFMNEEIKVDKVVLHFEDFNHSREEEGSTIRMFYFLENDTRRYRVPHLYMYYNKKNNIYHGGVEIDGGGFLDFNATSNRLRMNEILLSGADVDITPIIVEIVEFKREKIELDDSLEDIVQFSNVLDGTMSTSLLAKRKIIDYDRGEMFWIKGKKCTSSEDLNVSKIFYTEKEYIEEFKPRQKEDEYIHLFDEDFIEREEIASPIEIIQLKKSYTSIADMMNAEGFNFEWMNSYTIRFFMHNNKRAFVRVVSEISDDSQYGCSCAGYYLLALNNDTLKKMGFGWECGSFSKITIFEQEPIIMPVPIIVE